MLKVKWLEEFPQLLLCIIAFTVPFPYKYAAIASALFFIFWLLQVNFKKLFQALKERKILWFWGIYFLLFAVSYLYSDNKFMSATDTQTKLSILLMPIAIGAGMQLDKRAVERIFMFFIAGICAIAIYSLVTATVRYRATGDTTTLFYHKLVTGLDANAVYQAWYSFFAMAMLLVVPWEHFFIGWKKYLKIFPFILLMVFFLLLSARMLLGLFCLLLIPYFFSRVFKKRHLSAFQVVAIVLFFVFVGVALVSTDNPIKRRYADMSAKNFTTALQTDYHDVRESSFTNITLRLFIWRIGWENMKEHNLWWFGAGNGDAQDLQNDKMISHHIKGYDDIHPLAMLDTNMHNMFFQSWLMVGILGIILLIVITFSPFFNLKQLHFGQIFLVFNISAIFYMFQEAALQTQAGVIFYCLFSQIFWNLVYSSNNKKILTN